MRTETPVLRRPLDGNLQILVVLVYFSVDEVNGYKHAKCLKPVRKRAETGGNRRKRLRKCRGNATNVGSFAGLSSKRPRAFYQPQLQQLRENNITSLYV